jgi:hypothetical protein
LTLVSIVTPAYNAAASLPETVASVLAQSYPHWEYLIVNDGSKDNTLEVARALAEKDERIKVIDQANQGVSTARNTGLAAAKGELLAVLDADDTWLPDNLQLKVKALEDHPEADWVFSDGYFCDSKLQNPQAQEATPTTDLVTDILRWEGDIVPYPPGNVIMRRKCYDEGIRFDPKFSTAADQDFCLQLGHRYQWLHLPERLWNYRMSPQSMSQNIAVMEKDHIGVYKKAEAQGMFKSEELRQRCYAQLYLILAGSWWGPGKNRLRGTHFVLKALMLRPSFLGIVAKKALRWTLFGPPKVRKY